VPKKKTKEDQAEQSKAFIEKARELGADADKKDDEVMRRLAMQKRAERGRRKT
jgi:hypothetical protein